MNPKHNFLIVAAAIVAAGTVAAHAAKTIDEAGAIACINDKWDEKEVEKGHKLVDVVQRCVLIPNDPADPKAIEDCVGKFEYMPDGSWKGSGTCTNNYTDGGKATLTWEEGSDLKEYPYEFTGGTGKYQGAKGGGTYTYESLSDTLFGGTYKGAMQLP
jgi:hypothetical protein